MSDYAQRFEGIRRLYGDKALSLIQSLHICVVGTGGVGSWTVESLARSGVGELTLVDYDTVDISNTNRQIHTLTSTVGQKKIQVMADRCREINPEIKINLVDDFLNRENLADILNRNYHYVIDAIDSITFKAEMIYYCKRNKIPIIMTGGAGGLTDPSMIEIVDLSKTYNDALAAKVRTRLRTDYGFSKNSKRRFRIECVFSRQLPVYPKEDGTVSHDKPGVHGISLDCRMGYGTATHVTATFGFIAASRVIAKLLKKYAS